MALILSNLILVLVIVTDINEGRYIYIIVNNVKQINRMMMKK